MRRVVVALGVAALLAVGVAAIVVLTSRDGEREPVGSEPPAAWRIEYRVRSGGAESVDVVTVRRPFESRLDTEGDDGGRSAQVGAFARLRQEGSSGVPSVLAVPPGPAPSDVRPDVVIAAALDRGLLLLKDEREVAGRPCRVYRSGTLLTSGVLSPPADDEYADTCIDAVGLVLEEELVLEGEVVLRRTAVKVEADPDIDDGAFRIGDVTVPAASGGGSVLPLVDGTGRPGRFWVLDDPPAGFRSCGRFSVVPPQPTQSEDGGDDRVASVAEVFVRGRDLLVVDQGATLSGGAPFEPGAGEPVDLGPLGDGELVLGSQASEVRTVLAEGGYVRVLGTLTPRDLLAVARGLTETDGGDELRVDQDREPVCNPNLR